MSPRSVHRALYGGGEPDEEAFEAWMARPEAERKLDATGRPRRARLDPKVSLVSLGLVKVESRPGRPSHYTFNVERARELAARAQRKVLDHIDARDVRNAGKAPRDPGYEAPNVPPLPSSEDVAQDDKGLITPAWVADVVDRHACYEAIIVIDHALYGAPTDGPTQRASDQRLPSLHEPVIRLWQARGCGPWPELAAEVVRYTDTLRDCRHPTILTKWRGYVRDTGGWWRQTNTDWTLPKNINPSRFLKAERVALGLSLRELHEGAACGCPKAAEAPTTTAETDDDDAPGTVLATLLGPAAETDADPSVLWRGALAKLHQRVGWQDASVWFDPLVPYEVDGGAIVLGVPNRYYVRFIMDNHKAVLLDAIGCAVRLVQRRA